MWHSSFGNHLKSGYKVKEFFIRLSDEEINKIVQSIQGAKIEEMSAMGILRRVIKANPKLLLGLRHLLQTFLRHEKIPH